MSRQISRSLPVLAALLFTAIVPAYAADKITEADVRAFYKESAASYKLPKEQFLAKMDKETADTFTATAKTTINVPGQQPMQQSETMTKAESMAASPDTYETMKGATMTNQVTSVKVAADGKSAQVTDTTQIKNMSMAGQPGQPILLNGGGTCNDTVTLSSAGQLQMASSNCVLQFTMMQGH